MIYSTCLIEYLKEIVLLYSNLHEYLDKKECPEEYYQVTAAFERIEQFIMNQLQYCKKEK